ncbi:uncharacterized protein LOC135050911 [Pseudophryne corroboree]|uniref:uncharacterized protein LOC135050911 n=1 Tax=Pseudophryne corroboree TaxID=495146 RepID=UPI0030817A88
MLSRVPAMWSLTILLVIGFSTVNGQVVINCSPGLANSPVAVGSTTVALLRNCCIRGQLGILPTDTVVTLIGPATVIGNLNLNSVDLLNLPLYLNYTNGGVYVVDIQTAAALCDLSANQLSALLAGATDTCFYFGNLQICNGALNSGTTIRVVSLIYRDGQLIAVTTLSQPITLTTPKDYNSINTGIDHHSAGMIVITSILPILFAFLLAIFSSLLFMSCCCCNNVFTPRKCQQEN